MKKIFFFSKKIIFIIIICLISDKANSQSLVITPNPAFMGKIPTGSSSERSISVSNITTNSVNISSISVSGEDASKFAITNNPNSIVLGPLQKVILNVIYSPTISKMDIVSIEIQSNAGNYSCSLEAYGSTEINNIPTFERILGTLEDDYASKVKQTSDGGYIIVGNTTEPEENYTDAFVIKADRYGKPLWMKNYGGRFSDVASDLVLEGDSYIIAGTSDSYGNGTNDIYLLKINNQGDLIWSKSFSTTLDETSASITYAIDGGFIICGNTRNTNNLGRNALIIKIDTEGNLIWKRDYGSTGGETASEVIITSDNNYIFVGSKADPSTGIQNIYLVKIDASGNLIWEKELGGSDSDEAYSISKTNDGGYILSGYTVSYGNGARDAFLLKVNSDGNEEWHQTFGTEHSDEFRKVIQSSDGDYYCVGAVNAYFSQQFIYNDLFLVKTDSQGNLIWQKTFGGNLDDYASYLLLNNEGGYVIVGSTTSFAPRSEIHFIEVNSNGDIITDVKDEENNLPIIFSLSQNYPNPFNPETVIEYSIPLLDNKSNSSQYVSLKVYNILGVEVETLIEDYQKAGNYRIRFQPKNLSLSSGIYFYRLIVNNSENNGKEIFSQTKKMIYLK